MGFSFHLFSFLELVFLGRFSPKTFLFHIKSLNNLKNYLMYCIHFLEYIIIIMFLNKSVQAKMSVIDIKKEKKIVMFRLKTKVFSLKKIYMVN